MKQPIALVDCNNFYASCERIFRPDLKYKPIVVLSNNDGCIIARSNEAKALGIKMGAPVFKARPIIQQHRVQMFSANFPLYGDISSRVMQTLETYSPHIEIYSIDEAFLDLGHLLPDTLDSHGQIIRKQLIQTLKIPTSIGIAETKTLAKVAAHIAKRGAGVVNLYQKPLEQEYALRELAVGDVWGVGWRIGDTLRQKGIGTAWTLTQADEEWLLKRFGSMLIRTIYELRGIPCYQIENPSLEQKSITCSRSFSRHVSSLEELRQAVVTYTTRAAEKLRQHQQAATVIAVYIRTNRHRKQDPQYANSSYIQLPTATDCTHELIHFASKGLDSIYRDKFRYIKAQVTLLGLVSKHAIQPSLFDTTDREKQNNLMQAVDRINVSAGQNILHYASQGFAPTWQARPENRSPRYTTNWNELAEIT